MLYLMFRIGNDRYAMQAKDVVEVIPLVEMKEIPHAAIGVAGVFNYHGRPVPAVDLNQLAEGRPAATAMTTRIAVIRFSEDSDDQLLGIIAEQLTDVANIDDSAFTSPGITPAGTPYLEDVVSDESGMIQRVVIRELLPQDILESLFRTAAEADMS